MTISASSYAKTEPLIKASRISYCSDLFGDECGIAILSGNGYVAVVQEVESFIQLLLQAGGEAALIQVWATVQHHLSGLRGISETKGDTPSTG